MSGTIKVINGKSGRNLLEALLTGEKIDMAKITEMRRDKLIAANLKATDEQLVDDLNGVLSGLQKKMMRTMLTHIDQLAKHIKDLDDEIDRNSPAKNKGYRKRESQGNPALI